MRTTFRRRSHLPLAALAVCAALLLGTAPGRGAGPDPVAHEVEVERARPARPKRPTLRFLKENRDFLRAQIDRLREKPRDVRGAAGEIDPRFLAYADLLARVAGARDSVGGAAEAESRRGLFASVTELGDLESELDVIERQLANQRERLAILERDFTGTQETELVVVVSGHVAGMRLGAVSITLEDGTRRSVALADTAWEALRRGGVVQVFHGFVEPREQFVEVALEGAPWPAGESGFVTLEPARDRRTLLRLDLGALQAERGAASIRASVWRDDARTLAVDG